MRNLGYSLCFGIAAALLGAALPPVAVAQGRTIEVEAGPIWSQSDAQSKCPGVAKANGGTWTGNWRTTVPGRMSVCEVRVSSNGNPAPTPTTTPNPWRALRFGTATMGNSTFGKIEVTGGWGAVRRDDTAARACVSFKNVGTVTVTRIVFEFPIIDRSDVRQGALTLDRRGTFSPGIDIHGWSSLEDWQKGGSHRGYDENCTALTLNIASFPLRAAHFMTYRIKRVEYADGASWTPEGAQ